MNDILWSSVHYICVKYRTNLQEYHAYVQVISNNDASHDVGYLVLRKECQSLAYCS